MHTTASSYPQMLAWVASQAGPGSVHSFQEGHAVGDGLPIVSPSQPGHWLSQTTSPSYLLVMLGFLQSLCAHQEAHHHLGESLTCSQTHSNNPPAGAAQGEGGKVQEVSLLV